MSSATNDPHECSSSNNDSDDDEYMTRHAVRADRERHWKPLPGRARDDTELSTAGTFAAQQLATRLQHVRLAHIVSSPFYRCLQTVTPIAAAKGLSIKVEPGLCEVLTTFPPGFWDTPRFLAAADIGSDNDEKIPIDLTYRPVMTRQDLQPEFHDGQAAHRALRNFTTVKPPIALQLRVQLDGPILLCGHGASCLGMAQAFGAQGYVGYTSISQFHKDQNGGAWQVVQFGDVSHLDEELQRQALDSAW